MGSLSALRRFRRSGSSTPDHPPDEATVSLLPMRGEWSTYYYRVRVLDGRATWTRIHPDTGRRLLNRQLAGYTNPDGSRVIAILSTGPLPSLERIGDVGLFPVPGSEGSAGGDQPQGAQEAEPGIRD